MVHLLRFVLVGDPLYALLEGITVNPFFIRLSRIKFMAKNIRGYKEIMITIPSQSETL